VLSAEFCPSLSSEDRSSEPALVGWLIDAPTASLIYDDPRRLRTESLGKQHVKSAARCPAVIDMESRYFMITCPYDLHLRMEKSAEGKWGVRNVAGQNGAVRPNHLGKHLHLVAPGEWRHPDRPMLQIAAPYRFITDDPVYLTQCGPFMHYSSHAWPGLVFGGRFATHIWPRVLLWAFEWFDTSRDLIIKRGDPWFYVMLESTNPTRRVRLVKASMSAALKEYLQGIDGVTNYVNQTFSLYSRALERRPARLLQQADERQFP
jgi:hypothetical protein